MNSISMNGGNIMYLTNIGKYYQNANMTTDANNMISANDDISGLAFSKEELIRFSNASFETILNTDLSLPMELEEV